MPRTEFIATAFHVPARCVTNEDLAKVMDTADDGITQRSGIRTRYWVSDGETGASLAREAACGALAKAGLKASDLDCIVYCTCTPDHFEPGNGVFLQRELGLSGIPAIDVRNQCSGFLYGLAVMDGREVFKFASVLMPQAVQLALRTHGLTAADVKLLVPHQANLRIIEMVQKTLGLRDDQVYVNIQKYGNTTAASIPIALDEAIADGRVGRGDLLIFTAFGSGFTWGSAAIRW